MTEVYLKKNQETGRYECYNGLTDEYMQTLNCGNPFMLIPEDEDLEISIPISLEAALKAHIAYLYFEGIGTEDSTMRANNHFQKYPNQNKPSDY